MFQIISLGGFDDRGGRKGPFDVTTASGRPIFKCATGRCIGICHPRSRVHFLCTKSFKRGCYFKLRRLPTGKSLLFVANDRGSIVDLAIRKFRTVYFGSRAIAVPIKVVRELSFQFGRVMLLCSISGTKLSDSTGRRLTLGGCKIGQLLLPLTKAGIRGSVSSFFHLKGDQRSLVGLFLSCLSAVCDRAVSTLGSYRISFGGPPPITRVIISIGSIPLNARKGVLYVANNRKANGDGCIATLVTNTVKRSRGGGSGTVSALKISIDRGDGQGTVLFCSARRSRIRACGGVAGLLGHYKQRSVPRCLGTCYLAKVDQGRHLRTVVRDVSGFRCRFQKVRVIIVSKVTSLVGNTGSRARDVTIIRRLCQLTKVCGAYVIAVLRFVPSKLGLQKRLNDRLRQGTTTVLSVRGSASPSISIIGTLGIHSNDPLSIPVVRFT